MRHRVATKKLGRTTSHRTAMQRNMAASIIEHERITTTTVKAKAIRPFVEKLVTLAKVDNVHNRRRAFALLRSGVPPTDPTVVAMLGHLDGVMDTTYDLAVAIMAYRMHQIWTVQLA